MPYAKLFTVPTMLTLARILAVPFLAMVYWLPLPLQTLNILATVLFVFFAITDWLDGYLARRLNQSSAFGAFLDPVADKFLICAALLVLVDLQRVGVMVALLIIGREIAISALREWMAQIGAKSSVAVHLLGKLKTTAQMVAIPFLFWQEPLLGIIPTAHIGQILIWSAAAITLWSMAYYLRKAWPEIQRRTLPPPS